MQPVIRIVHVIRNIKIQITATTLELVEMLWVNFGWFNGILDYWTVNEGFFFLSRSYKDLNGNGAGFEEVRKHVEVL